MTRAVRAGSPVVCSNWEVISVMNTNGEIRKLAAYLVPYLSLIYFIKALPGNDKSTISLATADADGKKAAVCTFFSGTICPGCSISLATNRIYTGVKPTICYSRLPPLLFQTPHLRYAADGPQTQMDEKMAKTKTTRRGLKCPMRTMANRW